MLSLAVVAGPWSGRVLPVGPGTTVLGRSSSCDLVLPDPDVSRRHAALCVAHGRASVADLGSVNGTWLDGARVGLAPAALAPGALLRIGASTAVLEHGPRLHGEDPVASARRGPAAATSTVRLGRTATGDPVDVDVGRGGLGLIGPPGAVLPLARWVVAQLGLRVTPVTTATTRGRWSWLPSPPSGPPLVDLGPDRPSAEALTGDVPALALGTAAPMLCRTLARVSTDSGTRMRLDGGPEFVLDGVGEDWARRFAGTA